MIRKGGVLGGTGKGVSKVRKRKWTGKRDGSEKGEKDERGTEKTKARKEEMDKKGGQKRGRDSK